MLFVFQKRTVRDKSICWTTYSVLLAGALFVTACGKSPTENGVEAGAVKNNSFNDDSSVVEFAGSNSENIHLTTTSINWPDKIEPTQIQMELKKISEHAYFVEGPPGTPTDNEGFMSNAGVVITQDGVVVFDALGTPSLAFKLCSLIKAVTSQPIKKVIVSHYHADHIYGLQVLKDMGAEVIAPAGARDYLSSDTAQGRLRERRESLFPWVDENTYVVEPDVYIDQDTTFSLGGIDFELISLGSTHSQGDLMLRVKPDDVLFSGDLVFEGRIPFVAGSNPDVWMDRLNKFDAGSVKYVVPGHGGLSANPAQALQFTRDYLSYLHNTMQQAVDNLTPFDEAYSDAEWSSYKELPAFQANRMNAYFVYLRLESLSMQ